MIPIKCKHCKLVFDQTELPYTYILNDDIWICPSCNNRNKFDNKPRDTVKLKRQLELKRIMEAEIRDKGGTLGCIPIIIAVIIFIILSLMVLPIFL